MKNVPRGFTLLELLLVIALVIILFVAAIENLLPLRGAAERAAHFTTVSQLHSAVGLEATQRVTKQGLPGVQQMDEANAFEWLMVVPSNYFGETSGNHAAIPPGHWAFDTAGGFLVYRLRYPQYVDGGYGSPRGVRYQVQVKYGRRGEVRSVQLVQLDALDWQLDESELRNWLESMTS